MKPLSISRRNVGVTALLPLAALSFATASGLAQERKRAAPVGAMDSTVARATYFIGVGIDEYKHGADWDTLEGAVADLQLVSSVLEDHYRVIVEESLILEDGAASANTIWQIIREFLNSPEADEHANVIFYFAGHGYQAVDEEGQVETFLIPTDGKGPKDRDPETAAGNFEYAFNDLRWIPVSQLFERFRQKHRDPEDRLKQVLIIVDACDIGGQSFRGFAATDSQEKNFATHRIGELVTAAGPERPALERDGKGIFTGRFVEALYSMAVARADNGKMRSRDVFDLTVKLLKVMQEAEKQSKASQMPEHGYFLPLKNEVPSRFTFWFRDTPEVKRVRIANETQKALVKRFRRVLDYLADSNAMGSPESLCIEEPSRFGAMSILNLESIVGADSSNVLGVERGMDNRARQWVIGFSCAVRNEEEAPELECSVYQHAKGLGERFMPGHLWPVVGRWYELSVAEWPPCQGDRKS